MRVSSGAWPRVYNFQQDHPKPLHRRLSVCLLFFFSKLEKLTCSKMSIKTRSHDLDVFIDYQERRSCMQRELSVPRDLCMYPNLQPRVWDRRYNVCQPLLSTVPVSLLKLSDKVRFLKSVNILYIIHVYAFSRKIESACSGMCPCPTSCNCSDEYAPVCSTRGQNYTNACLAGCE